MWIEDAKFWLMVGLLLFLVGLGIYVEKNPTIRTAAPEAVATP